MSQEIRSVGELLVLVDEAVHKEDQQYWDRPVEFRSVVIPRYCYQDGDVFVVSWSQECARGPSDYDRDARKRLDDIAKLVAKHHGIASCTCHVGENAATLQAHITLSKAA